MTALVKALQRDRAKLERLLKLKLECLKPQHVKQRDRLFRIVLKVCELNEFLNGVRYFQEEKDLLHGLQGQLSLGKNELARVLQLGQEVEFVALQVKQWQSDLKDWETALNQARQQFDDADAQFTEMKQAELVERLKVVNISAPTQELKESLSTIALWLGQVQDHR